MYFLIVVIAVRPVVWFNDISIEIPPWTELNLTIETRAAMTCIRLRSAKPAFFKVEASRINALWADDRVLVDA